MRRRENGKGPNHKTPGDNVRRLFRMVHEFRTDKREKYEQLKKTEESILRTYESFTPDERVLFFAILYDEFAKNYDRHMTETGHYEAMRTVLPYAGPYLSAPLLDITAGTGELLKYAIELMEAGSHLRALRETGFRGFDAAISTLPEGRDGIIVANDVSLKALGKAKKKLDSPFVEYTTHDAYAFPVEGLYRTVLCSQIFHIISDEDKARMVKAIHRTLEPGGTAVIIEEDPFVISDSPYIDGIDIFLRAVACPVNTDILIGRFEVNGFRYLEHSAHHRIDSKHNMWVHIFERTE